MKEEGLLWIEHVPWEENDDNLIAKNLPGPTVKKHKQMYCWIDKYGEQGKVLKVMWDLMNPWVREVLTGVSAPCKGALSISHRNEIWSDVMSHRAATVLSTV